MIAIAVIGGLLVGLVVLLALRAASLPASGAGGTLEQIESYGYHAVAAAEAEAAPQGGSGLTDLSRSVGRYVLDRSERIREEEVHNDLHQAGIYNITPAMFMGYCVASALALGGLFFLLGLGRGLSLVLVVLVTAAAVVGGFMLPRALLRRRIQQRHEEIDYQMPQLVDILVVTVESGLALSRSLQVAAQQIKAPLGNELKLTLQEQEMGRGASDALAAMLGRCDTPSMRSFVRSITQGEQLGVSIGDIMRSLAHEMRVRRRQAAEARAQKAPVKILFPLVLLVFPALFVVLLYPAVQSFLNGLG